MIFVSIHTNFSECIQSKPLGMENGTIGNSQITSSTSYPDYPAWKGRLNGDGCWITTGNEPGGEWFQVDFMSVVTITAIQTQGYEATSQMYVTNLQIAIGNSQDSLYFIRDDDGGFKVSQ